MFFFRHPKPVTDRKEVAVLVQQNKAAAGSQEQVLIVKEAPTPNAGRAQEMQKGDETPPPA